MYNCIYLLTTQGSGGERFNNNGISQKRVLSAVWVMMAGSGMSISARMKERASVDDDPQGYTAERENPHGRTILDFNHHGRRHHRHHCRRHHCHYRHQRSLHGKRFHLCSLYWVALEPHSCTSNYLRMYIQINMYGCKYVAYVCPSYSDLCNASFYSPFSLVSFFVLHCGFLRILTNSHVAISYHVPSNYWLLWSLLRTKQPGHWWQLMTGGCHTPVTDATTKLIVTGTPTHTRIIPFIFQSSNSRGDRAIFSQL